MMRGASQNSTGAKPCTTRDVYNSKPDLTRALEGGSLSFGFNRFNPLALELDIYSLGHHLCTM